MSNANLQSQSFLGIRKKIIYAELEPGMKISEKELENQMKIGRTPIREALIRLRNEKLIYAVPQSGTYVSLIDMKSAVNALFVRETLEKAIMQECSANLTVDGQKALEAILEQQNRALQMSDTRNYFELDNVFHRTCYEIADREEIWQWLNTSNTHFERFRWLSLQIPKLSRRRIVDEHESLYSAIIHHNLDEISFFTTIHLHLVIEEKSAVLQKYPDYFTADSFLE